MLQSKRKLLILAIPLIAVIILVILLFLYISTKAKTGYIVDTQRALAVAEKLSYRQKQLVVKNLDKPSDKNGIISKDKEGKIFVNSHVYFDEDEIFLELYISDEYLKKTVAEMKANDIRYSKMLVINRIIVSSFLRSSIDEDLRAKDPVDVFPDLNETIDSDAMILRL